MLDDDAIDRAAHRLATAFSTRHPLAGHDELGADVPGDLDDAYAIAARMREVAGIDTGAWKVGATSDVAQQALGIDAPFLGVVSSDRIVPSGTELVVADWFSGEPAIEVEVGLRPRVQLDELPDDPLDLADRVDAVACIEIGNSRFGTMVGPPGLCLVADNGVASALVVGDPLGLDAGGIRDLGPTPVRLVVDGRDPIEGTASMALGHPLAALHVAARQAIDLGRPFGAGELVTTGSCTGLTPVVAGTAAVGTVGDAVVSVRFV